MDEISAATSVPSAVNSAIPLAKDVIQTLFGACIPIIAFFVYRLNVKINKAIVISTSWNHAQQRNLLAVQNMDALKAVEFVNTGLIPDGEDVDLVRRAIYVCFIDLNRINILWMAREAKLISESEVDPEIEHSLSSLLGNKEVLLHCLKRGYSDGFQEYVMGILPRVEKDVGRVSDHESLARKLFRESETASA